MFPPHMQWMPWYISNLEMITNYEVTFNETWEKEERTMWHHWNTGTFRYRGARQLCPVIIPYWVQRTRATFWRCQKYPKVFAVTKNSDFTTPTWVCPSIIFLSKFSSSYSPSFKNPAKVNTNLNYMFASWIYVCPSLCSPSCLLLQKQNRENDD